MPFRKRQVNALRETRDAILEQVRASREIIERSHKLLSRIDKLLAKAEDGRARSEPVEPSPTRWRSSLSSGTAVQTRPEGSPGSSTTH